ncbi:MAG: hypothetical protein M3Q07_05540 [Pseudobdellovibrionaceae bacterium]|nr:hypothetical protein [Pseudobdellovibrionaceae bacterium]
MANTPTTIASRFKQKFNKEISQVVPITADIIRRCEFRKDLETGASAEFDVQLSLENGFSQGTGKFALNGSVDQVAKRASVTGYSLILQSEVSYDAVTRAKGDDKAFARFASSKFIPMLDSFRNREEYHAMMGRHTGLGRVTGNSSGVLTIRADTWIPTLAASSVGATIVAYDAAMAATTAGGAQHNGDLTITAVDVDNRTITVSGTNAAIVSGDYLYFKGDYSTSSRIGLLATGLNSGTLWGIDASAYPLWRGNSYTMTTYLTLGHILAAAAKSAAKGCAGVKLVCHVPVDAFQRLVNDEAALVRHKASKELENGAEKLSFMGASGQIEVVPHLYLPNGYSVLWPEDFTYILGSQEATNQLDPNTGDEVHTVPGFSTKEMRMFSDTCGVFCEKPGFITVISRSDNGVL